MKLCGDEYGELSTFYEVLPLPKGCVGVPEAWLRVQGEFAVNPAYIHMEIDLYSLR